MAITLESTAQATANDSTTVVVTAPTGITTGELLVIVASSGSAGTITSTGFTQVLTQNTLNTAAGRRGFTTVLYKIAVLADESEANYTVSGPTNQMGSVFMLRLSGNGAGNPIFFSDTQTVGWSSSGNTDIAQTISATRPTSQFHVITTAAFDNDDIRSGFNVNSYYITSSDSNPTWTELTEVGYLTGNSSNYYAHATLAYATSTDTSAITEYGYTATEISGDAATAVHAYFTILTPQNASGSNTLTTGGTELFTAAGTSDASDSNTLVTATAATFAQTGTGSDPTTWTTTTKS